MNNKLEFSLLGGGGASEQEEEKRKEKIGVGEMFGNIDSTRYLYESNLQNIFNDYQENIATLDKTKQVALQDAYHIREMSKKYLGEYASNMDIGDVSGNLIDIYGSYQKNLEAIEQNYGELSMNLQQSFQQHRAEALNQLLIKEQDFRLEEKSARAQQVFANLANGDFGDFDNWNDYLKEEYKLNNIGFEEYQGFMQMMQDDKVAEVSSDILLGRLPDGMSAEQWVAELVRNKEISKNQGNAILLETQQVYTERLYAELQRGVETGYFGIKEKRDADGNIIEGEYEFDTSQLSLLEKYKNFVGEKTYNELYDEAEKYDKMGEQNLENWKDSMPVNLKLSSRNEDGKPKYDVSFNPQASVLPRDRNQVDNNSIVFEVKGMEFATVISPVEEDEFGPRTVDNEELDQKYMETFGENVTNGVAINHNGTWYYHKEGQWYRAVAMALTDSKLTHYQSKELTEGITLKSEETKKIGDLTIEHFFRDGAEMYNFSGKDEEGNNIQEVYKLSEKIRVKDIKDAGLDFRLAYEHANELASKNKKERFVFYYLGNYYEFYYGNRNTKRQYIRLLQREV